MRARDLVLGVAAVLAMAWLAGCQQIRMECSAEAVCLVDRSPQDRGGNSGEVAASTGVGASAPGGVVTGGE